MRRDSEHPPTSVKALALTLGPEAWTEISWREGVADRLTSRFARVRGRAAHRDYGLNEPRPQEGLLIEGPEGEREPPKYWFSPLPEEIGFARLVERATLRWRIERDYQELKPERGLGHDEGRGWRGFHHHASLCLAAYGFLVAERVRLPPPDRPPRSSRRLAFPQVIDPAAPLIRPERHVPNAIAAMRRRLTVALARSRERCACCATHFRRPPHHTSS